MESKEKFLGLFTAWIKRPGAAELLAWLETTDFFTAPAGAKHHGAYPGGLLEHSLNVCRELCSSNIAESVTTESMVLCALLHDVCKVGVYHLGPEPVKAVAEKTDRYTYHDPLTMGHGEKSVYLISRFIQLTDEEALAIRWHMGPYDKAAKGGSRELDEAMDLSPLVYELHAADMRAAQAEKRKETQKC